MNSGSSLSVSSALDSSSGMRSRHSQTRSNKLEKPRRSTRGSSSKILRRESSFTDQIYLFFSKETVIQFTILTFIVLACLYDYFIVGFHSGDVFILADLADLVATTSYLRSLDVPNERRNYLYSLLSHFFFYSSAGFFTNGLLLLSPKLPSFHSFAIFTLAGFLPVYFSPGDILFEKIEKDQLNQLVTCLVWTVSKTNSLKRSMVKLYQFNQGGLLAGFVICLFSCQITGILKKYEQNDTKNMYTNMLRSQSFHATLLSCMCLSLKFYTSYIVFDILAAIFLFLRYAGNDIFKIRFHPLVKEILSIM